MVFAKFFSLIIPQFIWSTFRFIYCYNKAAEICFSPFIFQRFNTIIFVSLITYNEYLARLLEDNGPISATFAAKY